MKTRRVLGVIALLIVIASQVCALDAGLYEVGAKGEIGNRFDGEILNATLTSTANDNTRCTLSFGVKSNYRGWLGLQAAERLFQGTVQSVDGRPPEFHTVIYGEAAIKDVIERYKPVVRMRTHPGHQIMAKFIQNSSELIPGEPLMATLRITNVGDKALTFEKEGTVSYEREGKMVEVRDNHMVLTATDGTTMLPDIGLVRKPGMSRLGGWVTIEPGSSHDISLDLTQWFNFQKGKSYTIRGSYDFVVTDNSGYTKLWNDFACAELGISFR